jgi:hypothetical protein
MYNCPSSAHQNLKPDTGSRIEGVLGDTEERQDIFYLSDRRESRILKKTEETVAGRSNMKTCITIITFVLLSA